MNYDEKMRSKESDEMECEVKLDWDSDVIELSSLRCCQRTGSSC